MENQPKNLISWRFITMEKDHGFWVSIIIRQQDLGHKLAQWIYKIKYINANCFVARHKTCLVAIGFSQLEGIDFNETFSFVPNGINLGFSYLRFDVHQIMNVKVSFLDGNFS